MHAVYTHTTSHTQTKHWTSLSVICMLLQFVWLVLATGFILLLLSNNFSPLSTPPHTPNPYMHTYAHTNTHTSLHPKTVCKIKSQWNMPCMIRRAAMQKCVQESSKNKALCFFWGGCDVWAGCVCVCVCLCLWEASGLFVWQWCVQIRHQRCGDCLFSVLHLYLLLLDKPQSLKLPLNAFVSYLFLLSVSSNLLYTLQKHQC